MKNESENGPETVQKRSNFAVTFPEWDECRVWSVVGRPAAASAFARAMADRSTSGRGFCGQVGAAAARRIAKRLG